MIFYTGFHHPCDADSTDYAFVSINALRGRKSAFPVRKGWILDSGAFTEISKHGGYREEPEVYGGQIERWKMNGGMHAAVCQDYMCEPFILAITGLSVLDHQRLTIERYDRIVRATSAYVMPVLQGYTLSEYIEHLDQWGARLNAGMRVGIGSVCKRNSDVGQIEEIVMGVKAAVGAIKLHGFGLKATALKSQWVRDALYSADSMAWSYAARREGRNANDPNEAVRFARNISEQTTVRRPIQTEFTTVIRL